VASGDGDAEVVVVGIRDEDVTDVTGVVLLEQAVKATATR